MAARKTFNVEKILQYANGFLSAPGGTKESRYGVICLIDTVLSEAGRYRGFLYLSENEVHTGDLPGIRLGVIDNDTMFEHCDCTRRRYL